MLGTTVNTNGSWLAEKLSVIGYNVGRIIVVPDRREDVVEELRRAIDRGVGVIITTGGLGPTYDDSTASHVASAINAKLKLDERAYRMVEMKYASMGEKLTPSRRKMAYIPENAVPLENKLGTAPGFYICLDKGILVSLPGVPAEMKQMFLDNVYPILKEYSGRVKVEERFQIRGWKESALAPIIDELAKKYPDVYVKSHPKGFEPSSPLIEVQLTVFSQDREEGLRIIREVKEQFWRMLETRR